MLICWFINSRFKAQGCGPCLTSCCYSQPSAGCEPKMSAVTVTAAHMYVHITVHKCRTQYSSSSL